MVLLCDGAGDERQVLVVSAALTMAEVAIVGAIAMVFSSFSSPFLTAIFTAMLFFIGRSADTLANLPERVFGADGPHRGHRALEGGPEPEPSRARATPLARPGRVGAAPRLRRPRLAELDLLCGGAAHAERDRLPEARFPVTQPARRLFAVALVTLVVLGFAWTGRATEGRRALADADAAIARADLPEAILHARIAAEARCPTCAAPDEGYRGSRRSLTTRRPAGTTRPHLRHGVRLARPRWRPRWRARRPPRRVRADAEVAGFAHRLDVAAVAAGATPTPAASEERLRATLADADLPGGTTFALIGLGGIVFLVAGARFAMAKAPRQPDRPRAGRDLGAALAVVSALLF